MDIFRFDPEVSIPITQFGSRFSIGELTGIGSDARVQVMHLPPGGLIGRHPTSIDQLFAVVAGSGWVSGDTGSPRSIRSGYAALWHAGEEHEAGSQAGLTAVCIVGRFEVWATAVTTDLVVCEYDPAWADWFDQLRAELWPVVEDVALRIEHVGSTSVPGLAAKPIIDLDVVVAGEDLVRPAIERLAAAGYRWVGELGVAGRQAFRPRRSRGDGPAHNLYLVVEGNKAHLDHWLLREHLISDGEARRRYADLKRRNAEAAGGDLDLYVAAKAALVAELLTRARSDRGLPPAEYWVPDPPPPSAAGAGAGGGAPPPAGGAGR